MAGARSGKSLQSPEKLDFSGLFLLVRGRSSGFLAAKFDCALGKIRVFRHGIRFARLRFIP